MTVSGNAASSEMMRPFLSVIICNYNYEAYISECIQSALAIKQAEVKLYSPETAALIAQRFAEKLLTGPNRR